MCRRINAQSRPNETRGLKTIFSKAMTRMPSWMSSVSDSAAIPHSSQMAASASWWPQGSAPPSSSHRDPGPYQKTEPRAGLEARGVPERPQCTCDPQGLGGRGRFSVDAERSGGKSVRDIFIRGLPRSPSIVTPVLSLYGSQPSRRALSKTSPEQSPSHLCCRYIPSIS